MAGYDSFRSIGPVMANVHATGLRTALWRGDLGTELPLLADGSPRPGANITNGGHVMLTNEQTQAVVDAVNTASAKWKLAFNSGSAAGCVEHYEKDAVMHARPFGTFTGTTEIQRFWQQLLDDGFSDVEYIDPKVDVVDETRALLTSGWKMNKAAGVIHKDLWVVQENGLAKLREDDFEATS